MIVSLNFKNRVFIGWFLLEGLTYLDVNKCLGQINELLLFTSAQCLIINYLIKWHDKNHPLRAHTPSLYSPCFLYTKLGASCNIILHNLVTGLRAQLEIHWIRSPRKI